MSNRNTVFISHGNPEDNEIAGWLSPHAGRGSSERLAHYSIVRFRRLAGSKRKEIAVQKRSDPDPKSQKYRDRYFAASDHAGRAYCDFLGFWRACRYRLCRRARGCRGDYIDCIVTRRNDVAERFDAARAHVRARVPKDVGAPERDAWLSEFCTATWAKSPRPRSNSIESDRGLES
jgi:hypothetical protein